MIADLKALYLRAHLKDYTCDLMSEDHRQGCRQGPVDYMKIAVAQAHQWPAWNPLPENNTATRTGAWLAGSDDLGRLSSPHTREDSIHGKAIVTPTPRSNVRRDR